jgi:hypothetical protein
VGEPAATAQAEVETGQLGQPASGQWEMRRAGEEIQALEQPADVTDEDPDPGLRIVQVSGAVEGAGIVHAGRPEVEAESVRMLFAWFPEGVTVGLMAARPAKAKGQDRDELTVACLGEPTGTKVFDPRLSSTYGDGGLLRRVGVELWLGESEEADLYSLRLAGEASGAVARLDVEDAVVQAQPFAAHSRGHSGIGVYLLIARP